MHTRLHCIALGLEDALHTEPCAKQINPVCMSAAQAVEGRVTSQKQSAKKDSKQPQRSRCCCETGSCDIRRCRNCICDALGLAVLLRCLLVALPRYHGLCCGTCWSWLSQVTFPLMQMQTRLHSICCTLYSFAHARSATPGCNKATKRR